MQPFESRRSLLGQLLLRRTRTFAASAVLAGASLVGLVLVHGCRDESTPTTPSTPAPDPAPGQGDAPPPSIDGSKVGLTYICDNRFNATNANPVAVTVTFKVDSTDEHGDLALRPKPADSTASDTVFSTKAAGTVRLYWNGNAVASATNGREQCETGAAPPPAPPPPPPPPPSSPEATSGRWSSVFTWPIVAVHLSLLPSGKVLSFGHYGDPQLWDPASGRFTAKPSPSLIFCAGHTLLADGRLLVAGGHIADGRGLPNTNVFDPATESWSAVAPMHTGRWYPTLTTLGDGSVLSVSGEDQNGALSPVPELWTGSGWRELTGARLVVPDYPRLFLAPNGRIYYVGEEPTTGYFDASGAGSWTAVTRTQYGASRDYGSAVMYQPGRILLVGGGNPPTATAEVIDLNQSSPSWRSTGSMAHARRHLNATLLPDGTVLVTSGVSDGGFNDLSSVVYAAEIWDPATGRWTTVAGSSVPRGYHSTTLLLPDGRVLHTGAGDASVAVDQRNAELYSPPYLFKGTRPQIGSAPPEVGYGQQFTIQTPDAAGVARVTWVRLSSVTHAFNMNQRFNELAVLGRGSGSVDVRAPDGPTLAPPGHYMMFLLTQQGVPSVAAIVRVR
jgi:galactose oxidase